MECGWLPSWFPPAKLHVYLIIILIGDGVLSTTGCVPLPPTSEVAPALGETLTFVIAPPPLRDRLLLQSPTGTGSEHPHLRVKIRLFRADSLSVATLVCTLKTVLFHRSTSATV